VVQLREENVGLEQKILNLREEISSLEEEKSKLALTQQSTNTQYFKLSESLDGFIGRLNIPAASYDRLEYSVYDI
jgi:predicted nuclease with TOPRIM domain